MSPAAAMMLEKEIYPIIRNTVPRTVRPQGSEDSEELVQDATASAAEMLESMEKAGKKPLPNSIAYYSIQRTKSGHRSYGDHRTDVMFPGFQQDHEGAVCSMQEPVSNGEDDLTIGDSIASKSEDMATKVLRSLDWEELLGRLDARKRRIVEEMMMGFGTGDIARMFSVSSARIVQLKREIAQDIKEFMGDDILHEAGEETVWERDIRCLHEQRESRHSDFETIDEPVMNEIKEQIFG